MIVKNKLGKSSFFNSVITLMSGSLIAQIITLVTSVFLTRLYTPSELGVYTLILTAESMFGSVICLRYDISIVSEKSEKKVIHLIVLSSIIAIVFSLITAIGYGYIQFISKPEYSQSMLIIMFIIVMLILRGIINILESYNNRNREYKLMSSVYIVRTAVQNGGAIILGLLGLGVMGLVGTHILGLFFGIKKQATTIIDNKEKFKEINRKEISLVAKENFKQPLYSSPAVFANRYSYSSISLFTENLFGTEMLGYYSISYKALGLPLTVLSNNVSRVFFRDASVEFAKTGCFANTFKKTSLILVLVSIPMSILIYLLAPFTFEIVFGSAWKQSGIIVQTLIPMFCVRFVVNTIAYGLQIVGKQNLELLFQGFLVAASVACFVISKNMHYTIESYLKMITMSFSTVYIIYFLFVMKYAIRGIQ